MRHCSFYFDSCDIQSRLSVVFLEVRLMTGACCTVNRCWGPWS
jgi:hypothetical protein